MGYAGEGMRVILISHTIGHTATEAVRDTGPAISEGESDVIFEMSKRRARSQPYAPAVSRFAEPARRIHRTQVACEGEGGAFACRFTREEI